MVPYHWWRQHTTHIGTTVATWKRDSSSTLSQCFEFYKNHITKGSWADINLLAKLYPFCRQKVWSQHSQHAWSSYNRKSFYGENQMQDSKVEKNYCKKDQAKEKGKF